MRGRAWASLVQGFRVLDPHWCPTDIPCSHIASLRVRYISDWVPLGTEQFFPYRIPMGLASRRAGIWVASNNRCRASQVRPINNWMRRSERDGTRVGPSGRHLGITIVRFPVKYWLPMLAKTRRGDPCGSPLNTKAVGWVYFTLSTMAVNPAASLKAISARALRSRSTPPFFKRSMSTL